MQIAIFIACCFIIGLLIVVCLELKELRLDIHALGNMVDMNADWVLERMPNTFEYNGNKGKV